MFRAGAWASVALLALSSPAQEGHPAPTPPPPGAKSTRCMGRTIPQLEDITAKTGITFSHTSDPMKKYIVESMSGGVLLLDYDRDGWLDIYFTNAPTVAMAIQDPKTLGGAQSLGRLYRNNHDGTFTDVTEKAGLTRPCFAMGGAVGDYNNDGWPDIYQTCFGGNILYRNNGNGTFTDVTAKAGVADGRWSTGASFGDYDGDGFVDLMVTNYVDFHLGDMPGFGSAANCKYRGIDVQCGPRGLRGAGDSLFHNNGDGTFTDVSKAAGVNDPDGYYGMSVIWADFNNTGRPDIYVANDSTPKYLYRNLGDGKFRDIGLQSGTAVSEDGSEQASMGIAVGDYLHSDRPSLAVTNFSDENDLLYRNDGAWNFTEVSYPSGVALPSLPFVKWGTAFVDLDNDGWLDLITADGHVYPQVDTLPSGAGYREPKLLQMNQGDGSFCDASTQAGPALEEKRASRGLAVGDLFNDGNMDVVVSDLDGGPMILRNHGVPGRHWVSFELAGTKSNRLALNARVKVVAGGMTQTDEVHSGGSYLSQNDMRLHFGLGAATKVDSVEIRWPSGRIETLTNLTADKFYAVQEGQGVVPAEKIRPALRP
ncbi:CRTAC1 family protein [Silvibacterium dinghuense]|uniref:CRTAC1 family protein n=2 Tax=Silvibacterium dinghuense TaxID=1560006 RepID=A0A4Q1S998_9BACT|nr:CRTAC1 family protein [Silvibacterium dinghuense]